MEKTKFSKHMREDRVDRYVAIATKVGFGEVFMSSTYSDKDGRWTDRTVELTTTGVCIVKTKDGTILTMYCGTLTHIKTSFKLDRLPHNLYSAITRNERHGYCNL